MENMPTWPPSTIYFLHTHVKTHEHTALETHRQGRSIIQDARGKCNNGDLSFPVIR